VIDVFASQNIPIETVDRSSGLIVPAGRKEPPFVRPNEAKKYADCGTDMGSNPNFPSSVKYNVVVRGDSGASSVQVRAFFYAGTSACSSTGVYESGVEGLIKTRAEKR
jgi:hypothetical protein